MADQLPQGSHFNYGTAETLELDRKRPFGMSRGHRFSLFLSIVAFGIMADQATKALMRSYLAKGAKPFIKDFMELRLVQNTGAAFSIGAGFGQIFIYVAAAVVLAAFLWSVLPKYQHTGLVIGLGLVSAGGLGNMVDRLMRGSVTDFLATTFINFPVFNLADIYVCVGIVLTVIFIFISDGSGS